MSTRQTISSDQLLPLTDPEDILRRARAEQRRLQQAASTAAQLNSPLEATETESIAPHAFAPLIVGSAPASLLSGVQLALTVDPQEPLPTPGPDPQDPAEDSSPMIPPSMTDSSLQAPPNTTT
ncbi:hypothetical protein PTTG_10148, partial [Puccinia triticina 1-1 BBBD Race 1]